ncbi:MAG: hypothetical protein JXA11_05105, partial [Phycisphaerae bacterium]|nr:hypothetical protein [Phycisphaerae bacterium]
MDTDEHPTSSSYLGEILEDTAWLERRILPEIPQPTVSMKCEGKEVAFTWSNPVGNQNSVRIYAVPKGTPAEKINESHIVGVIHRTGKKLSEMDPLLAVQKIRLATVNRWGGTMELPPPDDWRGKRYLPWKLRQIPYDENHSLPHSDNLQPLSLSIERLKDKDVYVSAVQWYGEESPPMRVQP